jgi:hypothetical protein
MFENTKVTDKEIFSVHQDRTMERVSDSNSVILAIQDTTFLNYNTHGATEGLGHIGTVANNHSQGLVMHTTLAFDVEKEMVLGMLDQAIWSRKREPQRKTPQRRKLLPIEQKESMKWLNALRVTHEVLEDLKKQVVTVADRESDIFEFMHEARTLGEHFLIRAIRNRRVSTEDGETLIWDKLSEQTPVGEMKVLVPRQGSRQKRFAQVEVSYCPLLICPTRERPEVRKREPVAVYGILVREKNPPRKVQGLEWVLLTDLEVHNFHQAQEKINWYKCRWQIEVFHKVLKTVCKVEACRLRSADQLKKYLTLASITAWKLGSMVQVSRSHPEESCSIILEEYKWKILQAISQGKKPSRRQKPPTMQEAIRWIAKLGGFAGRKGDGDPGVITLSRGWQELKTTIAHWKKIKEMEICG